LDFCTSKGNNWTLPTLKDDVDAANIFNLIKPGHNRIYLGGRKIDGVWQWNYNNEKVPDDLFKPGEKDESGQDCLRMRYNHNAKIESYYCTINSSSAIVCQRKN